MYREFSKPAEKKAKVQGLKPRARTIQASRNSTFHE